MSDIGEDNEVKVEIQKLLGKINEDMGKLKDEIGTLNSLIEDNASLPPTVRLVNERLMLTAKEAGIDLENVGDIENVDDLDKEKSQENRSEQQPNDDSEDLRSNVAKIVAAAEVLSKK